MQAKFKTVKDSENTSTLQAKKIFFKKPHADKIPISSQPRRKWAGLAIRPESTLVWLLKECENGRI